MCDITDHLPIFVQIKLTSLKSNKCNRPKIRNITPKLIERFVNELEETLVSPEMRNSTEIEKLNLMSRLTNQYFPKVNQSRKQYKNAQKPWITKYILRQMAQQNKLYKRFLRTRDPVVYSAYKQFRNHVTRLKENAKV